MTRMWTRIRRMAELFFGKVAADIKRAGDLPDVRAKPMAVAAASPAPASFYPDPHTPSSQRSPIQVGAPVHILKQMREELDDHLVAINQNTEEIQANHAAVWQLNQKVDKLYEKLEELSMHLQMAKAPKRTEEHPVESLSWREQEVFLLLYTADGFISELEIGTKLGLTAHLVVQYITNLMEKGIPITRKVHYQDTVVKLDPQFKEHQAKENIVGINKQLTLALATKGTFA